MREQHDGHRADQRVDVRRESATTTKQALKQLKERENLTLLSSGFEPVGDNLWKRENILFGREAALQHTRHFTDDDDMK